MLLNQTHRPGSLTYLAILTLTVISLFTSLTHSLRRHTNEEKAISRHRLHAAAAWTLTTACSSHTAHCVLLWFSTKQLLFPSTALVDCSWTAWSLKMGPTDRPETSASNYKSTPQNIPEDRRMHLYWGKSLKSREPKNALLGKKFCPFCRFCKMWQPYLLQSVTSISGNVNKT